jgi:predicted nucleotidyltransferase
MIERYKSRFIETHILELHKAIKALSDILKIYDIDFTIIGGAARNEYKYLKITEDIDILVAKEDKEKMKNIPIGYMKDLSSGRVKKFSLHEPKTMIDIIYEGEISGDGINGLKFVNPKSISTHINGFPYISLKNLIEYKLSSGIYGHQRYKDIDDIIELIKRNNLKKNFANNFRKDLQEKYIELWNETYKINNKME